SSQVRITGIDSSHRQIRFDPTVTQAYGAPSLEAQMDRRDWFWIIFLGAIWGCSFIFNAVLIREIGPLWVTSFRVAIGALGCWAVMIVLRKPIPRDPVLWVKLGAL